MKSFFILLIAIFSCMYINAQNVGIGTTTPQASFTVAEGNTVLFGTDTTNAGNKLMWLSNKGAFRAGFYANSVKDTIGLNSIATGTSSASGFASTAMGNSSAIGQNSTAIGNCTAIGPNSVAIGSGLANGQNSTAIGNSRANGDFSTAIGSSTANGESSTAMGFNTTAKSIYETVVGLYNDTSSSNRLFEIGNGTYGSLRNAVTVLNNGNVGINTLNPLTTFNVAAGNTVLFGTDTTSNESKLMWLPVKGAFRAGYYYNSVNDTIGLYSIALGSSIANGYASTAIGLSKAYGFYSTALGESKAQGQNSTAMGESQASGIYSTAMGTSISNGQNSTAMGSSQAQGDYSAAMGLGTYAKSNNETVIGSYNDTSSSNRLFEIGNGTYGSLSNVVTVLNNGNVGIGTVNPTTTFNVAGGNTVLFGNDTINYGNKMIWLPSKGAFRAGYFYGATVDSILQYSTSMGRSLASGQYSTALGRSVASGPYSTAMGISLASGQFSTAMGASIASGQYSTALGVYANAKSTYETVIGAYNDTSYTDRLFEVGNGTSLTSTHNALTILSNGNVGIGNSEPELAGLIVDTKVGAENAMFGSNSTGVCIESGWPGIAFNSYYNGSRKFISNGYGGLISLNESSGDMVFYGYGLGTAGGSPGVTTGMGLSFNCLYPLSNNAYTLGNSSLKWSAVWAVNGVIQTSDERLKKNITNSTYGLKEIMKLQPVTYDWKDGSNQQPMLGLLAQDVLKFIPEAVVGNVQKEYLGIKYDALIPVLIKGMQELENKNTSLGKVNDLLESKLSEITVKLETMQKEVETLAAMQKGIIH